MSWLKAVKFTCICYESDRIKHNNENRMNLIALDLPKLEKEYEKRFNPIIPDGTSPPPL